MRSSAMLVYRICTMHAHVEFVLEVAPTDIHIHTHTHTRTGKEGKEWRRRCG